MNFKPVSLESQNIGHDMGSGTAALSLSTLPMRLISILVCLTGYLFQLKLKVSEH